MNAMDSIKDLGESLHNWLTACMVGQEPSDSLLQAFWALVDLDMEKGSRREVEQLRAVVALLVEALPVGTPEPVMVAARCAANAAQEFTPKGASQVETLCLMAGFRVLQITALQAVYRGMQGQGEASMVWAEAVPVWCCNHASPIWRMFRTWRTAYDCCCPNGQQQGEKFEVVCTSPKNRCVGSDASFGCFLGGLWRRRQHFRHVYANPSRLSC